jgi:hypothetical protein
MNVATGQVLFDTKVRHSAKEVLDFFKSLDRNVPRELEIHMVLDNLSAHKFSLITTWLAPSALAGTCTSPRPVRRG